MVVMVIREKGDKRLPLPLGEGWGEGDFGVRFALKF